MIMTPKLAVEATWVKPARDCMSLRNHATIFSVHHLRSFSNHDVFDLVVNTRRYFDMNPSTAPWGKSSDAALYVIETRAEIPS